MNIKNIPTPVAVTLTLLIFVFILCIAMTATTEAESGFQLTSKEQQGMSEYYQKCPFKTAEQKDMSSEESIRKEVKFIDVSCDPEKQAEQVTVKLIGKNGSQAKTDFENWLQSNGLQEGDRLKITIQQ